VAVDDPVTGVAPGQRTALVEDGEVEAVVRDERLGVDLQLLVDRGLGVLRRHPARALEQPGDAPGVRLGAHFLDAANDDHAPGAEAGSDDEHSADDPDERRHFRGHRVAAERDRRRQQRARSDAEHRDDPRRNSARQRLRRNDRHGRCRATHSDWMGRVLDGGRLHDL
jgi:hypothetical protein